MLAEAVRRADPMRSDANQFMATQSGDVKMSGTVQHEGVIMLQPTAELAGAVAQEVAKLLGDRLGGLQVKVGDPIPSALGRR